MLTEPACSPVGTPIEWEALQHNTVNEATGGIWRVTGPGGTAILKHATPGSGGPGRWAASDDPHHWNYWKREYLAYTTGAAARYGEGTALSAPQLLAAAERPDGSAELWLEDVQGTAADRWDTGQFTHFARQLGAAQARHVTGSEQAWHSRTWLRQYSGRNAFADIDWDHPTAARHWPGDLRAGLRAIWERRGELFDRAEALPQTLCHLDVWPMNLTCRGTDPVLLDWAFLGRGAVGEDIANLIADTFLDGLQPVALLAETEQAVTDAYRAGLTDAGYSGERLAEAIAVTGAAKYAWLAPTVLGRLTAGKPLDESTYEAEVGSGDDAVLERGRPIFAMFVRWAHRAFGA
ncbi:hypothetical protein [Glycomyces arizonensis]|uniref:hypothetical protein n=1 Tax=Glycomyces arizonensis TaxID=256035 RepID=UPI0004077653|nr:hypothetical protein [Glycomyces arizonensis]